MGGPGTFAVADRKPARARESANQEVFRAVVTDLERCDYPADFFELVAEQEAALVLKLSCSQ